MSISQNYVTIPSVMKLGLFPFLSWLPEVKHTWKRDITAGILVSIITIPQSLAYSQMAGMPAYFGLYASFIPLILASLWGSFKLLATGPAVVLSLLSLSAISKLAPIGSLEFITYSAVLAVMVGVIQLLMGIFKLGNLVHFISNSVILGFVNATAVLIIFSQVVKILDIPADKGRHVIFSFINFFSDSQGINYESLFIGILALFLLVVGKKISSTLPLSLVVIIFATIYSKFSGYSGTIVGEIPSGLPKIIVPMVGTQTVINLLQPAVIVALVAYMNGISVAKTIALKTKEVVSGNQELIGQGLANMSAGFFGSSVVGGSLSRTALYYSTGAKTGIASITTGVLVAVCLLFFSELLKYIPQAVLAAIIIASVLQLLDFKQFKKLFIIYKYDGWIAIFSFLSTLILSPNLELGVLMGIVVSGIVYVHRSSYSSIIMFKANDQKIAAQNGIKLKQLPVNEKVLVISVDRSLLFTNAENVTEKIITGVNRTEGTTYVLLLCRSINFIDATAEQTLESLVESLKEKKVTVVMAGLHPDLWEFMRKLPLYEKIGKNNVFLKANAALEDLNNRA